MLAHLCRALVLFFMFAVPALGNGTVRIGVANPLSGPFAASGERTRSAVQLAADQINGRGGVLGRSIELIAADDGCGTDQAVTAALDLVAAGVTFVVGHRCSHSSLMAAPVYEAAGIPMMSTDSTHPLLTEEGRTNIFRLIGRDDEQGRIAGDWLAARRPSAPIGIVHDNSTYGRGLATNTRERLRADGVKEALFAAYVPGAADYSALVEQIRQARIGLLYLGGYGPDAGRILRRAREQGSTLQLVGGDGLEMEEFWAVAGPAGEGTIFTARRDASAEPGATQVLDALRARGLGAPPSSLAPYAAVQIWSEAAGRADSVDPAEIMEAVHRGRFATVLGRVAFNSKGDVEGAVWHWQVWRDGSYRPLAKSGAMH